MRPFTDSFGLARMIVGLGRREQLTGCGGLWRSRISAGRTMTLLLALWPFTPEYLCEGEGRLCLFCSVSRRVPKQMGQGNENRVRSLARARTGITPLTKKILRKAADHFLPGRQVGLVAAPLFQPITDRQRRLMPHAYASPARRAE